MSPQSDALALLAGTDIYLLDQIFRGRIAPGSRVLDAGCGRGRNLAYLIRRGFPAWGVDSDPVAIDEVRALAAALAPDLPAANFQRAPVEATGFDDGSFDLVISNAVLHFADDSRHFHRMIAEMWRVLAPGGLLFTRLATTIGIADRVRSKGGGWYDLPDGSSRFLVDERELLETTERLGAVLADPLKTTLVQNLRSMTTWVVRKSDSDPEPGREGVT